MDSRRNQYTEDTFGDSSWLELWWKQRWARYLFLKPDQAHTPFHRENSSSSHACLTRAHSFFRLCVSWMDVVSVVPVVFSLMSYRMFAKPVDYSGNFSDDNDNAGFFDGRDDVSSAEDASELVFPIGETGSEGSDKARMSSFSANSDQRSSASERSLWGSQLSVPGTIMGLDLSTEKMIGYTVLAVTLAVMTVGAIGVASFFTGGVGGIFILGSILHALSVIPGPTIVSSSLVAGCGVFRTLEQGCSIALKGSVIRNG